MKVALILFIIFIASTGRQKRIGGLTKKEQKTLPVITDPYRKNTGTRLKRKKMNGRENLKSLRNLRKH